MNYLIEPPVLLLILIVICFLSAALHSSVGLGGGSSYIAWLVIFSVPGLMIPVLALSLNIIVSAIGVIQFSRKKFMPWKKLIFILCFSVPSAYIGGTMQTSETVIYWLLLMSLLLIFLRLCFIDEDTRLTIPSTFLTGILLMVMACGLGFLSGLVGIGGGVFLVPMLVIFNILNIKQAAACGAAFILCNSSAGLYAKLSLKNLDINIDQFVPFFAAVILGALFGSGFALKKNNVKVLRGILKYTVLLACALLFRRLMF